MEQYLLGIDVGTTGTKSLLFSAGGKLLGHAYRAYETSTPQVSYNEQNPQDWWDAVCQTVREVCSDPAIAENVAAISLSLQGGTIVPVDQQFQPVRPAFVWSDNRCAQQKEAYLQEVGPADTMYQKTGYNLGNGLPALEIRWMRDNEPELFQKTAMFLSVPDYISWKMTGIPAVDPSDAGINQLSDIRAGRYDPELLRFAGIKEEQLAPIVPSGQLIGHLTEEAAQAMGLTTKTVLVAGAHDQYAVALGAGATEAGCFSIGSGTSWVITAISDEPDFSSGLCQAVAALPEKWGSLLSLSSGGVCLEWLRQITAGEQKCSYDEINRQVSQRRAAEDGLFFFPFSGKAGADAHFQKGTFVGMDLSHDPYHLFRAVMEGVAFQTVWMMESFSTRPSEGGIIFSGGASKSSVWTQMVADIAGQPVRIPKIADLACVGAAILAGVGCGLYKDAEEGHSKLSVGEGILYPVPENVERYRKLYETYKKVAAALLPAYS